MALVRVYCGISSAVDVDYVGIRQARLTAAVVDDSGRLLERTEINDDPAGYAVLTGFLAERFDGSTTISVAVDSDDFVVTSLLAASGRQIAFTDDATAEDYAERFADDDSLEEVNAASTERRAVGLARALRAGALSANVSATSREFTALKPVLAAHSALAVGRHAAAVALREVLRELYPAALRAYPDPAAPVALAMLDALPEPGLLTAAAGRGRDAAVNVAHRLVSEGVCDNDTALEAVTSLRLAITETPRRNGATKQLTAAIADAVRASVAAVRSADAASQVLVDALTERVPVSAPSPAPAMRRAQPTPIATVQTQPRPVAPPPAAPVPVSPAPMSPVPVATTAQPYAQPAAPMAGVPQPVAAQGFAPPPLADPFAPPAFPGQPGVGNPYQAQPQAYAAHPGAEAYAQQAYAAHPGAEAYAQQAYAAQPGAEAYTQQAYAAHPGAEAYAQQGYAAHPGAEAYAQQGYAPQPGAETYAPQGYAAAQPGAEAYAPQGYAAPPNVALPKRVIPNGTAPISPIPNGVVANGAGSIAGQPVSAAPVSPGRPAWSQSVPPPTPPGFEPTPVAGHPTVPAPRGTADPLAPFVPTITNAAIRANRTRSQAGPPAAPDPLSSMESRASWPLVAEDEEPEQAPVQSPLQAPVQAPVQSPLPTRVTPPWQADDLVLPSLRLVDSAASPTSIPQPSLRLVEDPDPLTSPSLLDDAPRSGGRVPKQRRTERQAPPPIENDDTDLLIFASVSSAWFTGDDNDATWNSVMDGGWRAAEEASLRPSTGGESDAGLPQRVPQANLVPGSPLSPERPLRIVRDAGAIAQHTSSYFRGWRRGSQETGGYAVGGRPGRESANGWDFARDNDIREERGEYGHRAANYR